MKHTSWLIIALLPLLLAACEVKKPGAPEGFGGPDTYTAFRTFRPSSLPAATEVGSFAVHINGVNEGLVPAECNGSSVDRANICNCDPSQRGKSPRCPYEFPTADTPVTVTITAEALDHNGNFLPTYTGYAMITPRSGKIASKCDPLGPNDPIWCNKKANTDPTAYSPSPEGEMLYFENGLSEAKTFQIIHAYGPMRIWVEDCGSWWNVAGGTSVNTVFGTFASGISDAVYFAGPTIKQMQMTDDNTTSPLVPHSADICAILSDPRYAYGEDVSQQGYSSEPVLGIVGTFVDDNGELQNSGPPNMGEFFTINRGRMVVTALDNAGFFVTDISPDFSTEGFNHLYIFNFNYPEGLEVGTELASLQGAPIEFTGTTQLQQPSWTVAKVEPSEAAPLPAPINISASMYASSLNTYGRNLSDKMNLEKLEGALVTMDNLAPATDFAIHFADGSSLSANCDSNNSGSIERANSQVEGELSPTIEELNVNYPSLAKACGISAYNGKITNPQNAFEYCCERVCYEDINCTEESSFISYYQWAAGVTGKYEDDGTCKTTNKDGSPGPQCPVMPKAGKEYTSCPKNDGGEACFAKIAIISTYAKPEFDPLAFAREQIKKPLNERKCLKVTGNLRQVLAARPVWVIVLRGPDDLVEHDCY